MAATGAAGERRLFVACLLPPDLAHDALAAALAPLDAGAFRVPRAEGLHFTLMFLGDVGGERVGELESALGRCLAGALAPRLRIEGPGAFPRRGGERVLWLGVVEEPGETRLANLHARVLTAVEGAGFDATEERSRPYRPHVTIARPRTREPVPEAFYAGGVSARWTPETVALVESVRAERGPSSYRPVSAWRLER